MRRISAANCSAIQSDTSTPEIRKSMVSTLLVLRFTMHAQRSLDKLSAARNSTLSEESHALSTAASTAGTFERSSATMSEGGSSVWVVLLFDTSGEMQFSSEAHIEPVLCAGKEDFTLAEVAIVIVLASN